MQLVHLSPVVTLLVDVLAWAAFHGSTGYLAHRTPDARLARDGRLFRVRSWEPVVYQQVLRVRRWKNLLPEAAGWFGDGVTKGALVSRDQARLRRLAVETRRAELAHWLAAGCSPFFVFWNPTSAAALMVIYGAGVNAPFVITQRFNRIRVTRLLEHRTSRLS